MEWRRLAQSVADACGHPDEALSKTGINQHLVDEQADEPPVESLRVTLVELRGREMRDRLITISVHHQVETFGVGGAADEAVRVVRGVEDGEVDSGIVSSRAHRRQRGEAARRPVLRWPVVTSLLIIAHSLVCVGLVFLILLHSGRDTGLSGAFGVSGASSSYGGSTAIVERNLDRITVVVAVLFFVTTYFLGQEF